MDKKELTEQLREIANGIESGEDEASGIGLQYGKNGYKRIEIGVMPRPQPKDNGE